MEKGTMKWVTRIGTLAVLLGFVFPSMMVSCSAMPGFHQSFSLMDLAGRGNMGSLYLLPVAIIAVFILTLIPRSGQLSPSSLKWGQVIAAGLGLLVLIGNLLSVNSQVTQYGAFEFSPEFGALFLIGGYILIGVGIAGELQPSNQAPVVPVPRAEMTSPTYAPESPPLLSPPPGQTGAYLQVIAGPTGSKTIAINDNYIIGRSSTSQIILNDSKVSRTHALIRCSQGMWFIQDQNSTGGTFVNGSRIQASRLNPGDTIEVGGTTFTFQCN
jgi:hypothetical protein